MKPTKRQEEALKEAGKFYRLFGEQNIGVTIHAIRISVTAKLAELGYSEEEINYAIKVIFGK